MLHHACPLGHAWSRLVALDRLAVPCLRLGIGVWGDGGMGGTRVAPLSDLGLTSRLSSGVKKLMVSGPANAAKPLQQKACSAGIQGITLTQAIRKMRAMNTWSTSQNSRETLDPPPPPGELLRTKPPKKVLCLWVSPSFEHDMGCPAKGDSNWDGDGDI